MEKDFAPESLLMTPTEAMSALRCGHSKLWEMIADGTLESVKIGHARRIKMASIRRVAEQGAA